MTPPTSRVLRPEEELVLLAAGTCARRQANADRASGLLNRVAWDTVLAELAYQHLVPLLGGRIVEMAGAAAPWGFTGAVREQTHASREAGALLELMTLRIASALEAVGVTNVPLKGPLLARALHGDPAMRSSRDIDVLVARADLGRAADALAALGWRPDRDAARNPVLHLCLVHPGGLPDVELHWRVHWYETEFGARALARSQAGAEGIRRLRAEDDLVALMLYQARDGFAGLRHPTDVAAWWDAHGSPSGPPVIEPILRAHPGLRRALTAAANLLERMVGVPAWRLVDLPARRPWGSRGAIALANPFMHGEPHQITAEVSLVDGLLAPKGQRSAVFRRRVLPHVSELPASSARRPLVLARANHTLRLLRRYALALARSRPRLPDDWRVGGPGDVG
jgi:putative nucleotidyltransferase-like protein